MMAEMMIHIISMVLIVMLLNSHTCHHNHHWHRNHHHCHEIIIIMVIIMVIMGDDSDKVFFPSHISLTVQQGTPSSFTAATNRCDDETWSPSSPNVYYFVNHHHQPITLCWTIVNIHIRAHLNIWNNICRMTSAAHRWSQSSSSSNDFQLCLQSLPELLWRKTYWR